MRVLVKELPDKKNFNFLGEKESGYVWQDKASPIVTLVSSSLDPWQLSPCIITPMPVRTKGLKKRTITGIKFKINSLEENLSELPPLAQIERSLYAGRCGYSPGPTLLHFCAKAYDAIPSQGMAEVWLQYSLLEAA